jgi:hypothetical protein
VGAGHGRAAGEPVAVDQQIVDGDLQVGEPGPERRDLLLERPNVGARLAMLRTALGDAAEPSDENAEMLLRTVLLLTSPMAWLYWKDYLGLDPDEAAATAGWAIKALARRGVQ